MRHEDRAWLSWRWGTLAVLLLVVGLPLSMPFLELLRYREGWDAWGEGRRLLLLAGNTLRLVAGTLALALPAGVAGAVLLYRTDLPWRRWLRFVMVLSLFVPLPLFASAWQAALGTGGWLPLGIWTAAWPGDPDLSPAGQLWKPWAVGIHAAIWIHAMTGLPWVILIVGQGLSWVEGELEEDALTAAGSWRVLWSVTLPRCRMAIVAAGLWVALQTGTEIAVTDAMQCRTFAEEVYTQIVAGGQAALARTVAVSLPWVLLMCWLVWRTLRRLEGQVLPLGSLSRAPLLFRLGRRRWLWLGATLLVLVVLGAVPVGSLAWKAGLAGSPPAWSAATACEHLAKVFGLYGLMLADSFGLAAAAGALAAAFGLVLCWLAAGSRWFQIAVLSIMVSAWVLPGPVVGLGLKEAIDHLLDWLGPRAVDQMGNVEEKGFRSSSDLLALALWYGPSPVPVLWAYLIRLFPFAVAMLWPVVRLIPASLHDAARVDGARPGQDLRHVTWPLAAPTCWHAALAVTVLSLGELSASKLVATPSPRIFAHELFTQMHYGVTNDLAALCLLLLASVLLGGAVVAALGFFLRPGRARGLSP